MMIVPLLICLITVTILPAGGVPFHNNNAGYTSNQSAAVRRLLGVGPFQNRCLWQMDQCNPYEDVCCKGMKCANAIGSYCRVRVEKCYCVPNSYGKPFSQTWN